MMIAFQVLLLVVIIIFSLGVLAHGETKEAKLNYTSLTVAAIIAMTVTFFV